VLAWNVTLDRLINPPDTDPVAFDCACQGEGSHAQADDFTKGLEFHREVFVGS